MWDKLDWFISGWYWSIRDIVIILIGTIIAIVISTVVGAIVGIITGGFLCMT